VVHPKMDEATASVRMPMEAWNGDIPIPAPVPLPLTTYEADILNDAQKLLLAGDDEVEQHGLVASIRIRLRLLRKDPQTPKWRRLAATAVDAALLFNTPERLAEKGEALRSALQIALTSDVPDHMAMRKIDDLLEGAGFNLSPVSQNK